MPLRAQVDGVDVVAPISDEAWSLLADRVRSKQVKLTLPCCGAPAFLRKSVYAIQHFVHLRNDGCEPESSEHLAAKFEIVRTCKELGLDVVSEYRGEGWRADVFVRTPRGDAAFEVQLSQQTFSQTLVRQDKFAAAGIRCCWLFRNPPQRNLLLTSDRSSQKLASARGTPMFRLHISKALVKHGRIEFTVKLNGIVRTLRQFVTDLLTRHLRYRSSGLSSIEACFRIWRVNCDECGHPIRFWYLSRVCARATCGAQLTFVHKRNDDLLPHIYRQFFQRSLEVVPELTFGWIIELEGQAAFSCNLPRCRKRQAVVVRPRWNNSSLRPIVKAMIEATGTLDRHIGHWCYSDSCTLATDETLSLEQAVAGFGELEWERVDPPIRVR